MSVSEQILASTYQNWAKNGEAQDAIFTGTTGLNWWQKGARNGSGFKLEDGGAQIVVNVKYAEMPGGKYYTNEQTIDIAPADTVRRAIFDWKFFVQPMTLRKNDLDINAGSNKIFDIGEDSKDTMVNSGRKKIATAMYNDGSDPAAAHGLRKLVPYDNTTGEIGGIPLATATYFRNYSTGSTEYDTSSANVFLNILRKASNTVTRGFLDKRPGVYLTHQSVHEAYEKEILGKMNLNAAVASNAYTQKMSDLGMGAVGYRGVPMVWDPYCPEYTVGTHAPMWLLNPEVIWMAVLKSQNFDMSDFMVPVNQPWLKVMVMFLAHQWVIANPRFCGVIPRLKY